MKTLRLLAALSVACAVLITVPAVANEIAVGRFVMELAKAKRLEATDAPSAVIALDRIGIRVPAETDLSKRLTEGDVVRLSRLAGLNITTTTPDASFESDRLGMFFTAFASELDPRSTTARSATDNSQENGPPFDPYSKGNGGSKGKKLGHQSPTDPG